MALVWRPQSRLNFISFPEGFEVQDREGVLEQENEVLNIQIDVHYGSFQAGWKFWRHHWLPIGMGGTCCLLAFG